MSDFLTSLVARSFGTPGLIRPRVTSLFEPVRGDQTSWHDILASKNEDRIEVREEEVIAGDPERRKPMRRERVLPGDEHGQTRDSDQVVGSSVPTHSPQSAREVERNPVTERLIERHETRVLSGETRQLDAPAQSAPSAVTTQAPSPIPKKLAAPEVRNIPAPVPPADKERPGQLMLPKLVPQMPIADLALRTKPERRYNEEHGFRRKDSQTSEPTIQVTIGRIEVRAIKENAHPSRPASASPVMSLDEYLRKRSQRVGQ